MASHIRPGQQIFQDQNFDALPKKIGTDATIKSSRTGIKKGGNGFGSRKALNDITNKSSVHHEASSKKNLQKEEFNIAEEMFLHDHKKCIEAQQKAGEQARESIFLDTVLPGHSSLSHIGSSESKTIDPESLCCYPEPEDLPMSEFSDWLMLSSRWESPPSSPFSWDSPPLSPFSWKIEPTFVLREEDDWTDGISM